MEKKQLEYSARSASAQDCRWHKFHGTVEGARINAVRLAKKALPASGYPTISIRDAVTKETLEEFQL
jgi:hypothetical protein